MKDKAKEQLLEDLERVVRKDALKINGGLII